MKLNKILALALSGVMAVSMLAGCSTDGKDEGNTEVTPPTSNAVSVMNDAQSLVKFEANADFDSIVAAAAKKAKYADVSASSVTYNVVNPVDGDAVYKELDSKLPANEKMQNFVITFASSTNPGTASTQTVLFLVKSNGLTEEAVLEQIAGKMGKTQYPSIVENTNKNYKATYTGNVSVVTVDCTDGGKTASAYYVAVSVTQTIAKDATV